MKGANSMKAKESTNNRTGRRAENGSSGQALKRVALYARVSTEEQTRSNYPSCESQIEELEAECLRRGWHVSRVIKDEGFTAGSLKRPGLTELRWAVQRGELDAVMCTWYDRLTRSREFYTLDQEFRTGGIEFVTLHDAADTRTAAGRFMESMIVAAKTYERDQTSEKVRTKMRMRLERGLHQGGLVPFGFLCDAETKVLSPDPEKLGLLQRIFELYVETESDFAVRDWLKAHGVRSPRGKDEWSVSSLCDLLSNRRYIAQIAINSQNQDVPDLPESEAYRVVKAPHEPLVPPELFERAQQIRRSRAQVFSNNGRKRGLYVRHNRCDRVFLLQGLMECAHCGHLMTPHYVFHRAGRGGRRSDSFICHYVCTQYRKAGSASDHSNRVLARTAEEWVLNRVRDLVLFPEVLERVLDQARRNAEKDTWPLREALSANETALVTVKEEIATLVSAITSGGASEALGDLLNERATELKLRREGLLMERRRLQGALAPVEHHFDGELFSQTLQRAHAAILDSDPLALQKLLRLVVKSLVWGGQGKRRLRLQNPRQARSRGASAGAAASVSPGEMENPHLLKKESGDFKGDWFDYSLRSGCPGRIRTSDPSVNSRLLYR